MSAVYQGYLATVSYLLTVDGVDLHTMDDKGNTLIDIARKRNHGDIEQLLLRATTPTATTTTTTASYRSVVPAVHSLVLPQVQGSHNTVNYGAIFFANNSDGSNYVSGNINHRV